MFAKIENEVVVEYPVYSVAQRFPNVSFPQNPKDSDLPDEYVTVATSVKPTTEFDYKVVEVLPKKVSGKWVQAWLSVDLTAEERTTRDEGIRRVISQLTQARLDAFAKTRGYDNCLSCCTYASSSIAVYAKEGQYLVGSRDATWGKLHDIMSEVSSGVRNPPKGYEDIEGELPALVWPE